MLLWLIPPLPVQFPISPAITGGLLAIDGREGPNLSLFASGMRGSLMAGGGGGGASAIIVTTAVFGLGG